MLVVGMPFRLPMGSLKGGGFGVKVAEQ